MLNGQCRSVGDSAPCGDSRSQDEGASSSETSLINTTGEERARRPRQPIKCYGFDQSELVTGPDWLQGAGNHRGVHGLSDEHYSLCDTEPDFVHLWFFHCA